MIAITTSNSISVNPRLRRFMGNFKEMAPVCWSLPDAQKAAFRNIANDQGDHNRFVWVPKKNLSSPPVIFVWMLWIRRNGTPKIHWCAALLESAAAQDSSRRVEARGTRTEQGLGGIPAPIEGERGPVSASRITSRPSIFSLPATGRTGWSAPGKWRGHWRSRPARPRSCSRCWPNPAS